MRLHYLRTLLGIQGYSVAQLTVQERHGRRAVVLELKRLRRSYECGQCRRKLKRAHSSWWIEVKHLTWWQYPTFLRLRHDRVCCPRCGLTLEPLPFVVQGARVTQGLAALVGALGKVMSVQAVALFQGLHRSTVKAIDKRRLEKIQAERPLEGIPVLGMDEIAVGKGHHSWTLVSALEGPRGPELLNVVEGRSEKPLERFWRWFGTERASEITHAVLDRCQAFEKSLRAHCRKKVGEEFHVVRLIYDKFHVLRHLNEALNTVRKAELRRALGRFKKTLSGKKFVWLARRRRVRGQAREALDAILAASPRLQKAYWLKESLGHLWEYTYRRCALRFWEDWKSQLKWSRLKPYHRFAQMMDRHLDGILAYCDKKVSLGYIESSNLKARNVIRRAYGYRDKEYMKLKMIQACTPWMGKFRPWAWVHNFPS